MPKRKKTKENPKITLDMLSRKRPRGRPGVRPSEIRNRGDHYRQVIGEIWKELEGRLLKAQTVEEVIQAFAGATSPYPEYFMPTLAPLVLQVLRDLKFPKTQDAQVNFLADSLAGRGLVSPRRSRDICGAERAKPLHYIVRQDYYIQCTCNYKGPASYGKCPKCGTDKIHPELFLLSGRKL